jgi:ankyrin repeat protein
MAGSVPAHYAATYGHNNIITLLAERDPASLMIQDNAGDTPAHDATSVRAGLLRSENTRCNAS